LQDLAGQPDSNYFTVSKEILTLSSLGLWHLDKSHFY
jgi:hypothetical protein